MASTGMTMMSKPAAERENAQLQARRTEKMTTIRIVQLDDHINGSTGIETLRPYLVQEGKRKVFHGRLEAGNVWFHSIFGEPGKFCDVLDTPNNRQYLAFMMRNEWWEIQDKAIEGQIRFILVQVEAQQEVTRIKAKLATLDKGTPDWKKAEAALTTAEADLKRANENLTKPAVSPTRSDTEIKAVQDNERLSAEIAELRRQLSEKKEEAGPERGKSEFASGGFAKPEVLPGDVETSRTKIEDPDNAMEFGGAAAEKRAKKGT